MKEELLAISDMKLVFPFMNDSIKFYELRVLYRFMNQVLMCTTLGFDNESPRL